MLAQQQVGRLLALLGIAHQHRHDVGNRRHHRQAGFGQLRLQAHRAFVQHLALGLRMAQVVDGGAGRFRQAGLQTAAGVPLQCGEPADFRSFRIGLFGLDKLKDVERTVATLERALDTL